MLGDLDFVAHVIPDALPDDETTTLVAHVAGRLDHGDDGAAIRVLGLAVHHRQRVPEVQFFRFAACKKGKKKRECKKFLR